MDFATAKKLVNPDPSWWPVRDSAEYKEILALMKQNGSVFLTDRIKAPEIPAAHMFNHGNYVNPLNVIVPDVKKKRVSKSEYMSLPSNKMKVSELLGISGIPMQIPEYIKKPISSIPTAPPSGKRISKEHFMKLGENRNYVDEHISYYKK